MFLQLRIMNPHRPATNLHPINHKVIMLTPDLNFIPSAYFPFLSDLKMKGYLFEFPLLEKLHVLQHRCSKRVM